MNVTTLFRMKPNQDCLSGENLYLLLDLPDNDPEKQAFLNHCSVCEPCLQQWTEITQVMEAGATLPQWEPDPALCAQILDRAYSNSVPSTKDLSWTEHKKFSFWDLPGWRFAWAALILIFSFGVYLQFDQPHTAYDPSVKIDEQISSLEQNLEMLQVDLEYEINSFTEDTI